MVSDAKDGPAKHVSPATKTALVDVSSTKVEKPVLVYLILKFRGAKGLLIPSSLFLVLNSLSLCDISETSSGFK